MKNKLLKTSQMAAIAVTMALGAPVYAQDAGVDGLYVAGHIGKLSISDWCQEVRRLLNLADGARLPGPAGGFFTVTSDPECSDSEIGFGIKGGYQINDFFAAEFGGLWAKGYDAKANISRAGIGATGDISAEGKISSYSIGGKGSWSVNDMISVHGILGFHFWDAEIEGDWIVGDRSGTLADLSLQGLSADGSDLYYGVGAAFSFHDHLSIQADYTQFKIDEEGYNKADYLSASLVYSF